MVKLVEYELSGGGERYCYLAKTSNSPKLYIVKMMLRLTETNTNNNLLAKYLYKYNIKTVEELDKHIIAIKTLDLSPTKEGVNPAMTERIKSILKTKDYILLNSYRNPKFNGRTRKQ